MTYITARLLLMILLHSVTISDLPTVTYFAWSSRFQIGNHAVIRRHQKLRTVALEKMTPMTDYKLRFSPKSGRFLILNGHKIRKRIITTPVHRWNACAKRYVTIITLTFHVMQFAVYQVNSALQSTAHVTGTSQIACNVRFQQQFFLTWSGWLSHAIQLVTSSRHGWKVKLRRR